MMQQSMSKLDFWRTLTRKINERVAIPDQRNIYQVGGNIWES